MAGLRDLISRAKAVTCVTALFSSPMSAVFAEPYAYITNQQENSVSVIDTATGTVTKAVKVGSEPAGVAVSRNGTKVCVTNPGSKDVTVLDGRTQKVIATLSLGEGPVGIAVDPAGTRAYVADWYGHYLSVLDLESLKVLKRVPVGRSPSGVVVSPDGAKIYVESGRRHGFAYRCRRAGSQENSGCRQASLRITLDAKAERLYTANVEATMSPWSMHRR